MNNVENLPKYKKILRVEIVITMCLGLLVAGLSFTLLYLQNTIQNRDSDQFQIVKLDLISADDEEVESLDIVVSAPKEGIQGIPFTAEIKIKNNLDKHFNDVYISLQTQEYVDDSPDSLFKILEPKEGGIQINLKPKEEKTTLWQIEPVAFGLDVPFSINISYDQEHKATLPLRFVINQADSLPDIRAKIFVADPKTGKDVWGERFLPGDKMKFAVLIYDGIRNLISDAQVIARITPDNSYEFNGNNTFTDNIVLEHNVDQEYGVSRYEVTYTIPQTVELGKYRVFFDIQRHGYELIGDPDLLDRDFYIISEVIIDAEVKRGTYYLHDVIRIPISVYANNKLISVDEDSDMFLERYITVNNRKDLLGKAVEQTITENPTEIIIDTDQVHWTEGEHGGWTDITEEEMLGKWDIELRGQYAKAKIAKALTINITDIHDACVEKYNGYTNPNLQDREQVTHELFNRYGNYDYLTSRLGDVYTLKYFCEDGNKLLYLFDFEKGVADSQDFTLQHNLAWVVDNVVHWRTASHAYFDLEDYRLEGTGATTCFLDKKEGVLLLFVCTDGHDSGGSRIWYSYDTSFHGNEAVQVRRKEWKVDANVMQTVKDEIYEEKLYSLFSQKFKE